MKEKRCFKGTRLLRRMKIILSILCIAASIYAFYVIDEYLLREQNENYWGLLYEGERDLVKQIIDTKSINLDSLPEGTIISKCSCSESGKISIEIKYPNEKNLNEKIEIELSNDSIETTPSDFSSKEAFIEERLAQELCYGTKSFGSILIVGIFNICFIRWMLKKTK